MRGFIEGVSRDQATLFPDRLDDFLTEDNATRVIDVFVDELDLSGLGFRLLPEATGRPGYHPAMMLKLFIYGYLNQVQSSRRLEREAGRNIELMWLTGRLAPDFKTIADFRKSNGPAIQLVCREFVMLCRKLSLFEDAFVAIDGSKFKAVNNRDKNFTKAKMKRRLADVDKSIERYLGRIASADRRDTPASADKADRLKDKVSRLRVELARLKRLELEMLAGDSEQLSQTDPDARSMKTRSSGIVGYNVQSAVDAGTHLIVAHEVTNTGSDRRQLANMSGQAKTVMGVDKLHVVADRGYYESHELKACEDNQVVTYVPNSPTSGNQAKGLFGKRDFIYRPDDDEYECPAGSRLIYRFSREEKEKVIRRYWTSDCPTCPLKSKCTTGDYRRVSRWEHEDVLERVEERLDAEPGRMKARRETVEHPFGTIKAWMGYTHFQMKTLKHVSTEMSLHVLAYNLKRVMALLGTRQLIAAIRA